MSTPLKLPESLPYPIVITSITALPTTTVSRGTPLLEYEYEFVAKRPVPIDGAGPSIASKERRFGTWESPVGGVIESWTFQTGSKVPLKLAKTKAALTIVEACSHPVQHGGLCAICGKDTTIVDYIGLGDDTRTQIQMNHDASGPLVSSDEAHRIEEETANRLRASRKLILIVDLDQTIVHATVDPTVGEWIAQGQAFEQKRAGKQKRRSNGADEPPSDDDEADDTPDEPNPNWDMLKDVERFRLGPDMPRSQLHSGLGSPPSGPEEGCDYFIKPRPGLSTFLNQLNEKFEMHVYTMGTRAYALQVCNVIDPNGNYFNQRILTRDESGSMTQKHIERLFPFNSSMVVIIDDRADVWQYSPNLVKVVPYDFFVGIGDINATFLPTSPDPLGATTPRSTPALTTGPGVSVLDEPSPESTTAEVESVLVAEAQTKAVATQLEERPLAKMQEALDAEEGAGGEKLPEKTHTNGVHSHNKGKAILKNDDWELERVWTILEEVHRRYFVAHDESKSGSSKGVSHGSLNRSALVADVAAIIPGMKSEVLRNVHVLFSSVIPLGQAPEKSEAWRYAHEFGAKCYTRLSGNVTHLVAGKEGTEKVIQSFHMGTIKVVWAKWFQDCIALWKHLDETGDYLLPAPSKRTLQNAEAAGVVGTPDLGPGTPRDINPGTDTPELNGTDTPGTPKQVELSGLDWAVMNDEIDGFLEEDDDDDDDGEGEEDEKDDDGGDEADEGTPGGDEGGGEDDEDAFGDMVMEAMFKENNQERQNAYGKATPPKGKLKRRRSETPSSSVISEGDDSDGGTPTAKKSRLNGGTSMAVKRPVAIPEGEEDDDEDDDDDDDEDGDEEMDTRYSSQVVPPSDPVEEDEDSEDEDDDESGEDEDFLSGLAEEGGWG